jgi:hypothetical protein
LRKPGSESGRKETVVSDGMTKFVRNLICKDFNEFLFRGFVQDGLSRGGVLCHESYDEAVDFAEAVLRNRRSPDVPGCITQEMALGYLTYRKIKTAFWSFHLAGTATN